MYGFALSLFLAQAAPETPASPAPSPAAAAGVSPCDRICMRKRAETAAAMFDAAAQHAVNADAARCYGAFAVFDRKVAEVGSDGPHGFSPRWAPPCTGAAVALTGRVDAGSSNVAFGNYDTSQQMAMSTIASVASGDMTSAFGSLLGGLFGGTGSLDDRGPFDPSEFSRISDNADAIFERLGPALEYRMLMAQQAGLGMAPENPAEVAAANDRPAVVAAAPAAPSLASMTLIQRAEHGDSPSQFTLGLQYLHGDGVTKNVPIAYKWLRLAASGGADAASTMADKLLTTMTPAQRSQAFALLDAFRREHAAPGPAAGALGQAATAAAASAPSVNGGATPYAGPNADVARFLLQHASGWTVSATMSANHPPQHPASAACQRDTYVWAATAAAWAANAHTAVGNEEAAKSDAQLMMDTLRKVPPLCSNAVTVAPGTPCDTEWLTCEWLKEHLG